MHIGSRVNKLRMILRTLPSSLQASKNSNQSPMGISVPAGVPTRLAYL